MTEEQIRILRTLEGMLDETKPDPAVLWSLLAQASRHMNEAPLGEFAENMRRLVGYQPTK